MIPLYSYSIFQTLIVKEIRDLIIKLVLVILGFGNIQFPLQHKSQKDFLVQEFIRKMVEIYLIVVVNANCKCFMLLACCAK